jgi:hypothetical protein
VLILIGGQRRGTGLGSPSLVSLANARKLAAEAKAAFAEERDPIILRCIPLPQPVPIDENDPAQYPAIVNPQLPLAFRKIGPHPHHLLVSQQVQVATFNLLAEPESDRDAHINGS